MSAPTESPFKGEFARLLRNIKMGLRIQREANVKAFTTVGERLAKMEARVAELEADRKNLRYCGIYKGGRIYERGNFVTHSGSIWHCNEQTSEAPGRSNAWVLAAKGAR